MICYMGNCLKKIKITFLTLTLFTKFSELGRKLIEHSILAPIPFRKVKK